jgi:hypothetical protein
MLNKEVRARFINEKFVEDSDPIADMGIGTRAQISRWMEERRQPDTDDNALAECAEHGKLDWVKFLIAAGADVHYWHNYALCMASANGHLKVVKELLRAGANVHANNDEALDWARDEGHQDVVDFLEDHIAKEKKSKKKSKKKSVRESLNEKFVENSDPVSDMGIGGAKYILDHFVETLKEYNIAADREMNDTYQSYNDIYYLNIYVEKDDDILHFQGSYCTDEAAKREFDDPAEGGWMLFDEDGKILLDIGHDPKKIILFLLKARYGNKREIDKKILRNKQEIDILKRIKDMYES